MKKILILIVLVLGLYPKLEQGNWDIGLTEAIAQSYGGEFDPENDATDVVPDEKFESFKDYLKNRGYTVTGPTEGTHEDENGVIHTGTWYHFDLDNGSDQKDYFKPNEPQGPFDRGDGYYSIGDKNGEGDPGSEGPGGGGTGDDPGGDPGDPGDNPGGGGDPGDNPGGGEEEPQTTASYLIIALNVQNTETALLAYINNNANASALEAMKNYLQTNGETTDNVEFVRWAMEFLNNNPTFDFEIFFSPHDFTGINTPPTAFNYEPLIDNEIEIGEVDPNAAENQNRVIGGMGDRHGPNAPDMQYGTNGDVHGVVSYELTQSDAHLFSQMRSLMFQTSILDPAMRTVTSLMVDKFQAKTGGEFVNATLTAKVKASVQFQNFLRNFGEDMSKELQRVNGDIDQVPTLNTEDYRPVFNGVYNTFAGLRIAINDTESNSIRLLNYSITGGAYWSANIEVTITDNFGLDKPDALKFQNAHTGFAAWYILQHTRGYVPFKTKIVIRSSIGGRL